jgi:hypothetical protein
MNDVKIYEPAHEHDPARDASVVKIFFLSVFLCVLRVFVVKTL